MINEYCNKYAVTTIDIDAIWRDRESMQDARNEYVQIKNETLR